MLSPWRQERRFGQSTVALGCLLQGLFRGILLVERTVRDDGLWRTAFVHDANQCPSLHRVGKLITNECQLSVHSSHITSR